ncbi:hypothetical protein LP420_19095 [Massilia sp. B-10]|nr:hypothetical protein LP420_19095 [Massilia sp. B-10]
MADLAPQAPISAPCRPARAGLALGLLLLLGARLAGGAHGRSAGGAAVRHGRHVPSDRAGGAGLGAWPSSLAFPLLFLLFAVPFGEIFIGPLIRIYRRLHDLGGAGDRHSRAAQRDPLRTADR